jgi:TonB family protein
MGYQALLFCPDEKTARTVTQVLSDLEFTIEACIEPFAAVKKLMGQHFDAVVVDCDNEQNATLLFKSARNSTSNQGSLAVAVVEGQAGVAKAFRIGANLVLTKPINIEQAKGTLRVARGLLRKGDPSKPAAATSAPAAVPAKPVAAKPVPAAPAAKAVAPATPAAVTASRPAAPTQPKPASAPAWPATATASEASPAQIPLAHRVSQSMAKSPAQGSATHEEDVLEIQDDSVATPSAPAPAVPPFNTFGVPTSAAAKLPVPAASVSVAEANTLSKTGSPATSGGAASAPAPAREAQVAEVSSETAAVPSPVVEKPAEAAQSESSSYAGAAPSFTFGGSNVPEQSSGGSKKILLGIAAAAIVAVALYFGSTLFSGRSAQPASQPPSQPASTTTPVKSAATAPIAKPSSAQPATPTPTAAVTSPGSQTTAPATKQAVDDTDAASDDVTISTPSSTKLSSSTAGKAAAAAKPDADPLVVKGGTARSLKAAPAAPDAPPPSMTGMATTGAGAPPPDLVGSGGSAPKPILQTMNVSQGVSQGLLIKKVQPSYPRNALALRVEGTVELMETISKTGDITHVKILSGDPQLTKAAADAVKQWKYKPYLLNGEPVEIQTQVTINFKLPN